MLKFLARLTLMMAVFVGMLTLVRAVGSAAQNPLAAMFSETTLPNGQKQLCWHGICPGQTALDDAIKTLDADKTLTEPDTDQPLCRESRRQLFYVCLSEETNAVTSLELIFTPTYFVNEQVDPDALVKLSLGDAMTLWGNPIFRSLPNCQESRFFFASHTVTWVEWVSASGNNGTMSLDPAQSNLLDITVMSSSAYSQENLYDDKWSGFITEPDLGCFGD